MLLLFSLFLQARLALEDGAGGASAVAKALTELILPSYFPQGPDVSGETQVLYYITASHLTQAADRFTHNAEGHATELSDPVCRSQTQSVGHLCVPTEMYAEVVCSARSPTCA